ncbi:hypothetical protein Btru_075811 [Bulinus truncatus]|nr:hypothetical protein Btru_075811 [Bulinus truncatus]
MTESGVATVSYSGKNSLTKLYNGQPNKFRRYSYWLESKDGPGESQKTDLATVKNGPGESHKTDLATVKRRTWRESQDGPGYSHKTDLATVKRRTWLE